MRKYVLFILVTGVISCGQKKNTNDQNPVIKNQSSLDSLSWILGSWEMIISNGSYIETWEKSNDSIFKGNAVQVSDKGDTVFTESITIEKRGMDIFYIPVIKDQNNGAPTLFKCTLKSMTTAKFENPDHDFPQIITYTSKGDSLVAEISGITEKVFHAETFPMMHRK